MQFGLVKDDIAVLADGVILLLTALLCVFVLVLVYIVAVLRPLHEEVGLGYRTRLTVLMLFLLTGSFLYLASVYPEQLVMIAIGAASAALLFAAMIHFGWVGLPAFFLFFLLWAGTVYVPHTFARDRFLVPAIGSLMAGTAITALYYFLWVRPLVRKDDNRIAFTMMVVGALGVLAILALLVLWYGQDYIRLETKPLGTDTLLQIASVVLSAVGIVFTYLMRTEQAIRTANQQIYQTLELQSVELFRFEANHPDLVEKLWYGEVPAKLKTPGMELPPGEEAELYVLRQYICQMLNLFEMAYRFRVRGIMEAEVYGSWVIWMWELCEADVFCAFWTHEDNLPANYVKGFSAAMTFGVDLRRQRPIPPQGELAAEKRKAQFFDRLAKDLGCPEIKEWLK